MSEEPEKEELRLVLIDDEEACRFTVSEALTRYGWTVTALGNEAGVSFLVVRAQPHIILMDLEMPGLTGEDLITTVMSEYGLPNTPVIFFSGLPEEDLRHRSIVCGAAGYIPKTIGAKELDERLRAFLSI